MVCISDGRANVPLANADGEVDPDAPPMDKAELKEEVIQTAKVLGSMSGFKLLMLDTENKFVSTGQVRVQSRPVAFLGEESELAAQAAECANEQGKFWDFHDTLYANQVPEHNSGVFSPENLKRFAEVLELETVAFDSCLDAGRYASKVRNDTGAAGQMGVTSVPTILVNGREVSWELETMQAAIREALGPAP